MNVKLISVIAFLVLVLTTSCVCAMDNSTEGSSDVGSNETALGDYYDDFNKWVVDENGNIVNVASGYNSSWNLPGLNSTVNNTTDLRNNVSHDENFSWGDYPLISNPSSMSVLFEEFIKDPVAFQKKYHADPVNVSIDLDDYPDYNSSCGRSYSKEFTEFMNFVAENSARPSSIESADANVLYSKGNVYRVCILNIADQSVGKGVDVVFTFNGKTIASKTDDDGYAAFRFSAQPGKYAVKISSGDVKSKRSIVVKPLFKTKDITKRHGKSLKFTVKLSGKSVSKRTVKITFKGKTHKIKTNSKGLATFAIPKNLKIGKYVIKTSYNGCVVKNKITVKR